MVHQAHKVLPEPGDYRPASWRDVVGLLMALIGLALFVGMTLTMFPLLGRTPPPWRWPPDVLATAFGTHAAYVLGVAAVDDRARRLTA